MSRQNRPNVFLDVDLKNPEPQPPQEEILDMKPPEEIPPPTEKEIFKQPKKDLVLEKPEGVKRKADRKTDQKRQVTPKMKAHLDRIRIKAAEGKKKKAAERAGVEYIPPPLPQVQEVIPPPQIPQPVAQPPQMPPIQESVNSVRYAQPQQPQLDYDQLADRLWSRQQKYNEEQKYISTLTEKIRREEREKALKESTTLLKEAASKYKKDHQAQLGRSVLTNYQNRYAGHPVFKVKPDGQGKFQGSANPNANPFDVCFK